MYVVSRVDLTPGAKIAQSVHGVADFIMTHPEIASEWHKNSNYIVCLSAKNESELYLLIDKLESQNIPFVKFTEPDLDNQVTSISAYGIDAGKLFSNLPLAMKEYTQQKVTI